MKNLTFPIVRIGLVLLLGALTAAGLFAQVSPVSVDTAAQANAPVAVLSQQQLESLVSPIALYPDPLLSQVLVASTYPLEIVEAAQWLRNNPSLKGSAAQSAASSQNWDPSVQALVVFPDVLFRMSDNIRWTSDLGNAFLAQQAAVMDAVQQLRSQAMSSGKLVSNPEATVATEIQGGSNVVEILPANPEVIYVPAYDPSLIWGPALYSYPFLPYKPVIYGGGFVGYSSCIFAGPLFAGWGGWAGWGWHPNWFGRSIIMNNGFFSRYGYNRFGLAGNIYPASSVWLHNPIHRANVPYANPAVAAQFHSGFHAPARSGLPSPSRAPAANVGRPASPMYTVTRPVAGNALAANRSGQFQAPRSNTSPQHGGPLPGFRNAPSPNFRSAPSPSFRSGPTYGGSSGMSRGGSGFGHSGGGGGRTGHGGRR